MDNAISFDILLRHATDDAGVKRLLAALGAAGAWRPFEPPLRNGCTVHAESCADGSALSRTVIVTMQDGAAEDTAEQWCRAVQRTDASTVVLLALVDNAHSQITLATCGLDGRYRDLVLEPRAGRRADAEILEEMAAEPGASALAVALRHARVLDRATITRQFFKDFRAVRERIAASWSGIAPDNRSERAQLALLFLCRLMFLYFLQRQGRLAGRADYLISCIRDFSARACPLYESFLNPLFFAVLNTRAASRTAAARALGDLPYLNGGLFERHALERRHPALSLPDDVVISVFEDVLERYRFTTAEQDSAAGTDAGISPEMMGLLFENLMDSGKRSATGSYYTPRRIVQRIVRECVTAYAATPPAGGEIATSVATPRDLGDVRVLDPACGSGAFLVGALEELAQRRAASGTECIEAARRDLVTRALHGVDLQEDAALLCALRLWLALTPRNDDEPAAPLPNLDRCIRQGDALIDPLDLVAPAAGGPAAAAALDPAVRRHARQLECLSREYATAEPGTRLHLKKRLTARENQLARAWLRRSDASLVTRARDERILAESRDLFGEETSEGRAAALRLAELETQRTRIAAAATSLADSGVLPYFSFPIHFAGAAERGFDLIFCNPPWLRAHRWAGTTAAIVRAGFEVCRDPGWGGRASCTPRGSARQIDLSLLFLERSLRLLAPGGVLGIVLPAKLLRSLYAGGARRLILRYTDIVSIEDHSLDQRSVFRADSFTCVLILKKRAALPSGEASTTPVAVTMIRRHSTPLHFSTSPAALPYDANDGAAPWLLVPAPVATALARMRMTGTTVSADPALRIRRGIATGANDVFVLTSAVPKLGGLTRIEALGARRAHRDGAAPRAAARYRAHVESAFIARLIRGCDIAAWRYRTERSILCAPPCARSQLPPRISAYLRLHGKPLPSAGALAREIAGPKVVWHDLARSFKAVAVPSAADRLIPLNTAYFVATRTDDEALILAALFNSLPINTFARALAERAKDAHFRFFAWLVALLPLPPGWRQDRVLLGISRRAHRAGGLSKAAAASLDKHVADAFGLTDSQLNALREFDAWLRGEAYECASPAD